MSDKMEFDEIRSDDFGSEFSDEISGIELSEVLLDYFEDHSYLD